MFKFLKGKTNLKIAGATMTIVFSLAAAFSGTIAWFATTKSQTVQAAAFEVVNNSSATMNPVQLLKFEYSTDEYGFIDYYHPDQGDVETYIYDAENHKFETEGGDYTDVMNNFDPAGYDMFGLRDLYCNAVYVISVSGSSLTNLKVYANIIPVEERESSSSSSSSSGSAASLEGETIIEAELSDYVDFDVYTSATVSAVTAPTYYPGHMKPSDSEAGLSETAKTFYKVDYLSASKAANAHDAHFYGTNPKSTKLLLNTLNFAGDSGTFYINVNYAPKQLEKYAKSLLNEKIRARYDFYFSIEL